MASESFFSRKAAVSPLLTGVAVRAVATAVLCAGLWVLIVVTLK